MTMQNGRAFNEWLRAQLKAKRMSQRQLALVSGVDHSTISRLIRGDRVPSLGTATKLARGLRELTDDTDPPTTLGIVAVGTRNPAARVEYALRADETLSEAQIRQVMELYLSLRARSWARTRPPQPERELAPARAAAPGSGQATAPLAAPIHRAPSRGTAPLPASAPARDGSGSTRFSMQPRQRLRGGGR